MKKLFSTCLLVQGGNASPDFMATEVNLHPGKGISSDQGETVRLAGGFSSITPECGFHLSSTFQLNYDLATFSLPELEQIARAELERKNAVNYRSYTVEMDNRVCMIGDDAGKINELIDQYGGVLAIEPLLLKDSHPDMPAVAELTIACEGSSYRLAFQVRSPINTELCSYCGVCSPACPEGCISENLFLAFDKCTLCKECEKVCVENAIDIHSVVHETLEVPALIIVGDVEVNLPENITGIFFEKDLPRYFSTLFPCRIDEVISCDNSICQYSGRLGRGCDLCISNCGYGAIIQDGKGVTVDPVKCEECGSCVAVCPTGALQNERFNDRSFFEYFENISIPQDAKVIIGNETTLHKLWWQQNGNHHQNVFFLEYDTIRSLSLWHFMFFFNQGARRILVLEEESSASPKRIHGLEKQIEQANILLESLYDIKDAVAGGNVNDFTALMAAPAPGSCGVAQEEQSFVNRRLALAFSLEKLVEKSGRQPHLNPAGYVPFASMSCNTLRCTHCMACLNECHIKALTSDQQQMTLNYTGIMCVGCGICAGICPEDALTLSSDFTLAADFFAPVELAKAEPMACKKCGKIFGTRKSFERVMAILSQKEIVDTSHFEYCDTCRVVKLFEVE